VGHLRRVERRADSYDGDSLGDMRRCRENRSSAQAVTHQDQWRRVAMAQHVGCSNEVLDVGREVRVGKVSFAVPEAGEVEAKDANSSIDETACDLGCSGDLERAREAMRKQREGNRIARRKIKSGVQAIAG
jgi:hypothetical protein